jgi:hypothetical protein
MNNHQYFAQIDENNLVVAVHVVTQQFIDDNPDRYPGTWVETFVDLPNKTYAAIGFTYDETTKDFIAPYVPPRPSTLEA